VTEKGLNKPRYLSWIFGVLAGVAITIMVSLAILFFWAGATALERLAAIFSPGRTIINIGQPTVVNQIQKLARLETVMYTLENVIEGGHENLVLPDFLTGDRILLIGHGEVIAGVDLSRVGPNDVIIHGKSITLRIPKPQILSTRIDNQKTRVFSRQTGILVPVDPNLETEVRREAETQLREAALRDGILAAAEQNARATLTTLLQGFGFETITLEMR
jgi:hypothetical protein